MPTPIGGGLASDPEPKFRTLAGTFGKGADHTGTRADGSGGLPRPRARQWPQRVRFPIYPPPTALFPISRSDFPYSVPGCNLRPNWELLQPGTLYGKLLKDIGKSAVGASNGWIYAKTDPPGSLARARPGQAPRAVRPGSRVVGALPKGVS